MRLTAPSDVATAPALSYAAAQCLKVDAVGRFSIASSYDSIPR
jgi:hypothetical protein